MMDYVIRTDFVSVTCLITPLYGKDASEMGIDAPSILGIWIWILTCSQLSSPW